MNLAVALLGRIKIPLAPFFKGGVKSPFGKGGFRGILVCTINITATKKLPQFN